MPSENLPAKELTWEFDPLVPLVFTTTSEEVANQQMHGFMSYQLTGTMRKAWGGTFAAGSLGNVRFTATEIGSPPPHALQKFTSDVVGKSVTFVGSNSPGNDGTFTIVDYDAVGGDWIEFNNGGTPVFEVDSAVSVRVDNGKFTNPWVCKGSGAGSTGKGAGMDGKDRWLSTGDIQSSTSGTGNRSWFCYQNVNGGELMVLMYTNSTSLDFVRCEWWSSPELGFTGGTSNVAPTAVDGVLAIARTSEWLGDSAMQNDVHYPTYMASSDGSCHLWFNSSNNDVSTVVWSLEAVDVVDGPTIPWNGGHNIQDVSRSFDLQIFTHSNFNDNANVWGTIDKDGAAGGPYTAYFYLTSEMVTTAMTGQHWSVYTDSLSGDKELCFQPIGLASPTTGLRGRHGRLRDLYWINSDSDRFAPYGATFPSNGSRQWIKIGEMLFPWDGVTKWRRN